MPPELYRIVRLFHSHNLKYNLFKCEHIFDGENKNLDVLFLTEDDYKTAGFLLRDQSYLLYLSENTEKYKEMYVKVEEEVIFSIHLHREIAWHNLKVLNKKNIFRRQILEENCIFIPSPEDSLLIHVSHIIFENHVIKPQDAVLITFLVSKQLDWMYIKTVCKQYHLQPGFSHIIDSIKRREKLNYKILLQTIIRKISLTPSSWPFIWRKIITSSARRLSLKRRGCLISFIGVQGTGKTTLTRELLRTYEPITSFFNGQQGYYFGWEPFTWYSRILSVLLKKSNTQIFESVNKQPIGQVNTKPGIKKATFLNILFIYNYVEYIQRYLFCIYPQLRKNKLMVTDRYFYDLYSQYTSASESRVLGLLLKLFPKPDHLFVLTAETNTILGRGKDPHVYSAIKKDPIRPVVNPLILETQKRKYESLRRMFGGEQINTEQDRITNCKTIIQKSWKTLLKR